MNKLSSAFRSLMLLLVTVFLWGSNDPMFIAKLWLSATLILFSAIADNIEAKNS